MKPGLNLTQFPKIYQSKTISIVVPKGTNNKSPIFFDFDSIIDNSIIRGVQFEPLTNIKNASLLPNSVVADISDAKTAVISLVNKHDDTIINNYPVNGLFIYPKNDSASPRHTKMMKRFFLEIILGKCYLIWTGGTTANNLYFYFTFYYEAKKE